MAHPHESPTASMKAPDPGSSEPAKPRTTSTILKAVVAASALAVAALAVGLAVSITHTASVSDDAHDTIVLLNVNHAKNVSDIKLADARAQTVAIDTAVKAGVAKQKTSDASKMKRALARARRAADKRQKKAVDAARTTGLSQGYSNGTTDGYSAGNSDGYDNGVTDGLVEGSDDLTCSDDMSVTWLPSCSG
jgi:hypothetical protein